MDQPHLPPPESDPLTPQQRQEVEQCRRGLSGLWDEAGLVAIIDDLVRRLAP